MVNIQQTEDDMTENLNLNLLLTITVFNIVDNIIVSIEQTEDVMK